MYKYFFQIILILSLTSLSAQQIERFIEVVGTHELKIKADQIVITLRIRTIDKTLEKSKLKNDQTVNEVINVLQIFGNLQNDVELAPLSFGINYKRTNSETVKDGFYTSQQITFLLKDIEKYYKLINKIIKIENLSIDRTNYNNSHYEELNKQAYENAVTAAFNKADYLAKKAKAKLGKVIEIIDNSRAQYSTKQSYPNPFNSSSSLTVGSSKMFGSLRINRNVRIKYELKEE